MSLHVEAPAVSVGDLRSEKNGEPSAAIRARVQVARECQHRRFAGTTISANARMPHATIRQHCALDATRLLEAIQ
jgi:magnesium chelatase family protein